MTTSSKYMGRVVQLPWIGQKGPIDKLYTRRTVHSVGQLIAPIALPSRGFKYGSPSLKAGDGDGLW